MHQSYVGYFLYTELLFFLSGVMLIGWDAKKYAQSHMEKESRAARLLGWVNLVAGVLGCIGYFAYSNWIM